MTVPDTLVLGIGNRLWADEGFGPAVIDCLLARQSLPADAEVLDGGTLGLYLLPQVQAARYLLVFDTLDFGRMPGELLVLRDDEIPAFFGQRPLSLHQVGFSDVLAAAQLTGQAPRAVTLVGVQPQRIDDWGGQLTELVTAAIVPAIDIGLAELALWHRGEKQQ